MPYAVINNKRKTKYQLKYAWRYLYIYHIERLCATRSTYSSRQEEKKKNKKTNNSCYKQRRSGNTKTSSYMC